MLALHRYKLVLTIFSLALVLMSAPAPALEKVRLGTPLKTSPLYVLPVLAANEKGFWSQEGLQVEWFAFAGGALMTQALAAGSLDMGIQATSSAIEAISRGIPLIIVADLQGREDLLVWVPTASPIKQPEDLKGKKIGITRFGSLAEAHGKVLAKALGLEKQIKFVAAGGVSEYIAALKTGAVDGVLAALLSMAPLKYKGEVREIVATRDFMPKEYSDVVILARKDYLEKKPEAVKAGVRAILQATDFIHRDREWSVEKMQSFSGYSADAARGLYEQALSYSKDGRIDKKVLENVINFLVQYGMVPKEKAPPVERLFASGFAR